jgi:type IV pilus assembly protein PilY1
MKAVGIFTKMLPVVSLLASLHATVVLADPGSKYCVTPPFITAGLKPNLLLMIDNSASMYDLAYSDNALYKYCANAPATSCTTVGATCSGTAYCLASAVTTSSVTTTPIACTATSQCAPATGGTCPSGATCTWVAGDTCNTGKGQCKNSTSTVTVTTTTPVECSDDAPCQAVTSGDTCNNKCKESTRPCIDNTYNNSAVTYPGYFRETANYCYSSRSNNTTCTNSGTYDQFDSGATIPATCTYGGSTSTTPYVCVDVDTGTGLVTQFVATGKFLNWLATSKFDSEKKILTGGKYRADVGNGNLIGETRGCVGRSFIKTIPGIDLTFAIRGGDATISTTSQAAQYGTTYIEIYQGAYNTSACTAAMNDWSTVSTAGLGPLQTDSKQCIGGTGNIADQLVAANQAIHDCYWYYNGHGLTNLQPIKNVCVKVWANTPASSITDPNSPAAICSNQLTHSGSLVDGNTEGFLGSCFTAGVWDDACALKENKDYCQMIGGSGAVADPPSDTIVPETVQNVPGFMTGLGLANLPMINDYTAYANGTKGFMLAVHGPTSPALSWPPQGLIQKYQDSIRFGAMTFQNNGSGTECNSSGYCSATSTNSGASCTADATCSGGKCLFSVPCAKTCSNAPTRQCYGDNDCTIKNSAGTVVSTGNCNDLAKSDGGAIISYVGAGFCGTKTTTSGTPCVVDSQCTTSGEFCKPSIGTHATGLLSTIENIEATSWTPFAEGFYNAMGYFARSNAYTLTPPASRRDDFPMPGPENTATSYDSNEKNPSQYRCQSNNILLITDGMSTADQNSHVEDLAALYADQVPYTIGGTTYKPADLSTTPTTPATTGYDSAKNHGFDTTNKCPDYAGSRSISDLAWVAKNRNIKTLTTSGTASTTAPVTASESISTYVVYSGPQTTGKPGLCDPQTLMANTATNGGTTLLSATNPAELETKLDSAFSTVAAKAASGTAASILSNSEGSGANILQAVFYPQKIFDNATSVNWIGEMQNLWYYVDPYIQNSTIREDTTSDLKLNIINDYVVRFSFDNSSDKTMVQRYSDSNGDAIVTDSDKVGGMIDPDYVKSIWRAGMKLWARNPEASPARKIYTGYSSTVDNLPTLFTNDGTFEATSGVWDALQIPAGDNDQRTALATKLISYVRGTDPDPLYDNPFAPPYAPCLNADCKYRPRKVTIKNICSITKEKRCTDNADCPAGETCNASGDTREWKLGDIISSTPRVQSTVRLNTYNLPAPGGYNDQSYDSFVNTSQYRNRGMVYVGANDGMLHAFELGVLHIDAKGAEKASLDASTTLGQEKWAFIPTDSLPYLKYTTDTKYSHIYSVDGRTVILDASIGDTNTAGTCDRAHYFDCVKSASTWRTIVITGMGQGGASRNNVGTETCTEGAAGNCVRTPLANTGHSSYVALDVTYPNDPNYPKYLWEFNANDLGYATSAPAIVRIGDKNKNGKWFAVFGNGPLGPIDTGTNQFLAESTGSLTYFVVDLRTGVLAATLTTGITNAFSGTLLGGAIDADRRDPTKTGNYQDDAIYGGYVKKGADNKWSAGGVIRILTKEDPDPNHWVVSEVIKGIGPVTTAVARSQDTKNRNLWLYFGTGRFFYRDSVSLDDNNHRRSLFGVQDRCYNTTAKPGNVIDGTCTEPAITLDPITSAPLVDQTDPADIHTLSASDKGWRIKLDVATSTEGAERVVTDTVALTNGTVFFTSFKPNLDICGYGGNSYLWGVKYDTGDAPAANALKGKALIQLSTGEFKEVDLSTAFTDKGNRRMLTPMTGKPPSDAPPIISNSQNKPVKKILHMQEH